MDWKKIAPWNWLEKEQEGERALPATRAGDPFAALRLEMDRAFEDTLRRFGGSPGERPLLRPSVDISEARKAYTVRVEVPGVEKGDVTIDVEGDALRIRGEKKQEQEESEEGYHRVERSYGAFERVLSLPEDADAAGVVAKFRNGVLKITIPKREVPESRGRSIEILHE